MKIGILGAGGIAGVMARTISQMDDAQNYAKITENLQYLLANKYIKYADLSLRKRLILWSFLRGKFRLLKWIKE